MTEHTILERGLVREPTIVIERLDPNASFSRETEEAAAYDLKACLAPRLEDLGNGEGATAFAEVPTFIEYHYTRHNELLPTYPVLAGRVERTYSVTLEPGDRVCIPLGFKARLPKDNVAVLAIRSGTALKRGLRVVDLFRFLAEQERDEGEPLELANGIGIIDADYPREWMALVENTSAEPALVEHGERLVQALVFSGEGLVHPPVVDGVVTQTTNRTGGFNSTGTR
jgi:dUTPase